MTLQHSLSASASSLHYTPPRPTLHHSRRRIGAYVLVHDPDGIFRPWRSVFPEVEVLTGLRLRTWTPGTLFFHLRRGLTYEVSETYTLEVVENSR